MVDDGNGDDDDDNVDVHIDLMKPARITSAPCVHACVSVYFNWLADMKCHCCFVYP